MNLIEPNKFNPIIIEGDDINDNIFFTSDTHFNHAIIIKSCSRPFSNVKEMKMR